MCFVGSNIDELYEYMSVSIEKKSKMGSRPTIIVITPIRNEAWVLDAFLTHTSSWADYIIIADHHSTDGSREIVQKYPKAILFDNPTVEWHENVVRTELLRRASLVPGDKIIFGLDADEFLSEGFEDTAGWKKILTSKPNTIFCFRWLNLFDNFRKVEYVEPYFEWACHFSEDIDIVEEYKKREGHAVHCSRVPCLEVSRTEYVKIEDIRFVHLAKLNKARTMNKLDFYQVTWVDKNNDNWNPISFYRSYSKYYPDSVCVLPDDVQLKCANSDIVVNELVQKSDHGQHYIDEMIAVFKRDGVKNYLWLNIWKNPFLCEKIDIPIMPIYVTVFHCYLTKTQRWAGNIAIKCIDSVLKRFF